MEFRRDRKFFVGVIEYLTEDGIKQNILSSGNDIAYKTYGNCKRKLDRQLELFYKDRKVISCYIEEHQFTEIVENKTILM